MISIDAVVAHEQPAREPLMHVEFGGCKRAVGKLLFAGMHIAQQQLPHLGVIKDRKKIFGRHLKPVAGHCMKVLFGVRSTPRTTG